VTDPWPWQGASPAARDKFVGVVDTTNSRLLIHAGFDPATTYGVTDDLWAYDLVGNSRTDIMPSGTKPVAREYHVGAVDTNNRLLIHGGQGKKGVGLFDDFWAYDFVGNSWTDITPSGTKPVAREYHAAAMDTSNSRLLIHGGADGSNSVDDFWAYDFVGNSWTDITPSGTKPGTRYNHVAVVDTYSGRLLIHGGEKSGNPPLHHDLWAYDLGNDSSWTDLTGGGWKSDTRAYHMAA